MKTDLVFELQKVGLDEREARVYLAALELGPSPVQKIAQRAAIPRATVYLVLSDLQNKGVVTTYDQGKKTYFVAEPPQRLGDLAEGQALKVKQQQDSIQRLIPELEARGRFEKSERPVVRYYEGNQAVTAFLRDSLLSREGEILNILHLDRATETLQKAGFPIEKVRERRAKHRIKSRVIYTTTSGKPIDNYSTPQRRAKFVAVEKYPFEADISISGNRVFFVPYGVPLRGVAIEDKAIAGSLRKVFEALWGTLP